MVKYPADSSEKAVILRLFNKKYPYEYLESGFDESITEQIREFYRKEHGIL